MKLQTLGLLPLLCLALACAKTAPQTRNDQQIESGGNGGGSSVRGGGDEVALEFQNAFARAIQNIKANKPELLKPQELNDLVAKANEANIVVVDTPLTTTTEDGAVQFSVAVNDPGQSRIDINRKRWNAIINPHIREALALHEIASLLRIERTGKYKVSSEYIRAFSLDFKVLEPVTVRCSGPRSEQAPCENRGKEVVYAQLSMSSILSLVNTRTDEIRTLVAPLEAQQVSFTDEGKNYSLIVKAPNMGSAAFGLWLAIISEQPTDEPRIFEMNKATLDIVWQNGRFVPGTISKARLIKTLAGDGSADGTVTDMSNGITGSFSSAVLNGGTQQTTETYRDLNVDMGKIGKDLVMRALVCKNTATAASGLQNLGSYGVPVEIERKLLNAIEKFAIRNSEVNRIKTALNECRENCSVLRDLYNQADRERDQYFMDLPANSLN